MIAKIKKICSVGFINLLTIAAWCQTGEVVFGIQVSPTVGWMKTNDNLINSNGVKVGIKIGGLGEYYLSDWMAVSVGFGFSFSQGGALLHRIGGNFLPNSELSDDDLNHGEKPLPDDVDITYSLHVLDIPFGAKYVLRTSGDLDFFAEFPVFTISLVGQSRGAIQATGIDIKGEDIGKDVNALNFSWGFGAGIERILDSAKLLQAGLYFQNGLADLTRDEAIKVEELADGTRQVSLEDSRGVLNMIIFKFAIFF
ncbi:MAG: PorT family protein [Saprospiraceae bacterium]|nr:PorT family protein [Saprospiraceae bacterium]